MSDKSLTYKDSGVDIDAGNKVVSMIKSSVKDTYRSEVVGDLGGFGGLFALDIVKYKEPILVSGTDGVGTKLSIAFKLDKHDTIGQDAVAMCVNDILVQGAEPLFFLDYLATGVLEPEKMAEVIKGIAKACKESGCSLIGGETAEMAGFYKTGEYDIAGFAVGVVERSKIITGANISKGDVLLGIPSSGIHSNGYSLVRKICFEHCGFTGDEKLPELEGKSLGEVLLTPTRLYPKLCLPLINKFDIKGMVHITGGGFYENVNRVLPQGTRAKIDVDTWQVPSIFNLLQKWGNVKWKEMYRVFNMGIGMVLAVDKATAQDIIYHMHDIKEPIYTIGEIVDGDQDVVLEGRVF